MNYLMNKRIKNSGKKDIYNLINFVKRKKLIEKMFVYK